MLAERLRSHGYHVVASENVDGAGWSIEASCQRSFREAASTEITRGLVSVAIECGGEYDGWGAVIKPKIG